MKVSVFIATSLDGFIARRDGSLDWLDVPEHNEDYGYAAFMDTVDAIVMGRNTYDVVLGLGPWPYGNTPVIVPTRRPLEAPNGFADSVEATALTPSELVAELQARGVEHIYVDGGRTIQSFLAEGLIDRLTITTIPALIGDGIRLFGPTEKDIQLRHVDTIAYTNGLVQSTYDVI